MSADESAGESGIMSKELEHFKTIPWCARIIESPDYEAEIDDTDVPQAKKKNTFFGVTLNSPDTIRATLQLNRKPDDSLLPHAIQEIVTLCDLGSGMNGYESIAHGGFLSALLDHHTGTLIYANHGYADKHSGTAGLHTNVTVSLNIRFMGPVVTPCIILMRSKYTKIEPKKLFVLGTVEDSKGKVLASAEALFITPRNPIAHASRI